MIAFVLATLLGLALIVRGVALAYEPAAWILAGTAVIGLAHMGASGELAALYRRPKKEPDAP